MGWSISNTTSCNILTCTLFYNPNVQRQTISVLLYDPCAIKLYRLPSIAWPWMCSNIFPVLHYPSCVLENGNKSECHLRLLGAIGVPKNRVLPKKSIWVFPKWLSLNSANSVNHDKIQDQYGYQKQSTSDNTYIPSFSGKKEFSTTTCRLVSVKSGDWQ